MILHLIGLYMTGVLMAFTPCNLPLLPVLFSILVDNPYVEPRRAIILSMAFSGTAIISYGLLGALGGLLGVFIQGYVHTPLFVLPVCLLLIVMALVQLDVVSIPYVSASVNVRRNSVVSSMILGFVSTLTMSPCLTPVLVGLLTYVGSTGNVISGFGMMSVVGLGMCTPLLIVSTVGLRLLPRPGKWMNVMRYISAFTLVVLAVYLGYNVI